MNEILAGGESVLKQAAGSGANSGGRGCGRDQERSLKWECEWTVIMMLERISDVYRIIMCL